MFLLKLGSELQNLVKKFAVQYENINKLQTAFPRSGMCRGGGGGPNSEIFLSYLENYSKQASFL